MRLVRSIARAVLPVAVFCLFATAASASATVPESAAEEAAPQQPTDEELELEFAETDDEGPTGFPDPLEPINRCTLRFNRLVDRVLLDPITHLYQFVFPHPVRVSIRQFFTNLDSPAILANDLLQREWNDARVTVVRFGINTTVGVAGFFDPASHWGWEGHYSDFGQTLALEGVPSGAYIIVPILGPNTVRDGIGDIVDILFRPVTFILGPAEQIFYTTIHGGGYGLAIRDEHAEELAMLERSSVDFYAALRSAYYQTRTAEIWARRRDHDSLSGIAVAYYATWEGTEEAEVASR